MATPSCNTAHLLMDNKKSQLDPERARLKAHFLHQHNAPQDVVATPLPADFSHRRYERLTTSQPWVSPSVILMDAPPAHERVDLFVKIQGILERAGVRVPALYGQDLEGGFLLLEDFGHTTYNRALATASSSQRRDLYARAVDVVCHLHAQQLSLQELQTHHLSNPQNSPTLPSPALLMTADVLVQELGALFAWGGKEPLTAEALDEAEHLWKDVLSPLDHLNTRHLCLVLRDYHVDNLMVVEGEGIHGCGVLDFQDALCGHQAYDLVSLLQDARVDVEPDLEAAMKKHFYGRQPSGFDQASFEQAYGLLALQRGAKIFGQFRRRARRDGNYQILKHLPRVGGYVQRALTNATAVPSIRSLHQWFNRFIPLEEGL